MKKLLNWFRSFPAHIAQLPNEHYVIARRSWRLELQFYCPFRQTYYGKWDWAGTLDDARRYVTLEDAIKDLNQIKKVLTFVRN